MTELYEANPAKWARDRREVARIEPSMYEYDDLELCPSLHHTTTVVLQLYTSKGREENEDVFCR